jgi:A/G-specific adenine glycosylase
LWQLAESHLPAGHAAEYNQALMELGATLCRRRAPQCARCPLVEVCQAYALGKQTALPVRQTKTRIPHRIVAAAVIRGADTVLLAQRPAEGLLGGLWEFPGGTQEEGEDLSACLQREIQEELGVTVQVGEKLGTYTHAYSHFRVTLHAFECYLEAGQLQPLEHQNLAWVQLPDLTTYPMGKLDRLISRRLLAGSTEGDRHCLVPGDMY